MITNERPNLNETLVALRTGICNLVYQKMDGEKRVATGTLNLELVPKEKWPKNQTTPTTTNEEMRADKPIHYFDLSVNGWRCFWLENLTSLSLV
jgi:hypothetical protein